MQKFEPLQENETALIALRGDLMRIQTDMFESGVLVTAEQLRERMAHMEAQGAFRKEARNEGSDETNGSEHLRELIQARAAIEFDYHPNEHIEHKYDRVTLQTVSSMMRQVAMVQVEQLLQDENTLPDVDTQQANADREAMLEDRIKQLSHNVASGVTERLRDAGGPTGGYYGGWQEENGERTFHFDQVDVERWARKAKWGGAGLNERREERVAPQEQADLLTGYFAGELALLSFGKEAFRGGGAIDTLRLIAQVEGRSESAVAAEYANLLTKVRNDLTSDYPNQLDQTVANVGLVWNEEQQSYGLESDPVQ